MHLRLRQRQRRDSSPVGTVLVVICSPALIALHPDFQSKDGKEKEFQAKSADAASVGVWVRAFEYLRILHDGWFIVLRVTNVRRVDAEEDVPVFFEADKVCQCSLRFLSSLIQHGHPPPGINALPSNFIYIFQTVRTLCHDRGLYIPSDPTPPGGLKKCQPPKLWVLSTLQIPCDSKLREPAGT